MGLPPIQKSKTKHLYPLFPFVVPEDNFSYLKGHLAKLVYGFAALGRYCVSGKFPRRCAAASRVLPPRCGRLSSGRRNLGILDSSKLEIRTWSRSAAPAVQSSCCAVQFAWLPSPHGWLAACHR